MIDKIIARYPYLIYTSDLYPYDTYIGIENPDGTITMYL